MSHTPPVPADNQSPYPLQTPPKPHDDHAPPPGDPRVATTPPPARSNTIGIIAVGAGLGLGLAAIAGGLFMTFRDTPKRKRPKGKAAARKPKSAPKSKKPA